MKTQITIAVLIALSVIGAVLLPLLRKPTPGKGPSLSDEALDQEVARYGVALKSGTLCDRCLSANPPRSRYCAECGFSLQA